MAHNLLKLEEEIFKVIANQKRLEIIWLLHDRELNVSEMLEMLGLRQSNLSQHLSQLRKQKLVHSRKNGREVYYSLSDPAIAQAVLLIHSFLQRQHGTTGSLSKTALFPIVTDPICGMRLSTKTAFMTEGTDGQVYHFCASGCKETFLRRQLA